MPEIPENATKPSDHKKKTEKVPERFSFEAGGETYTLGPTDQIFTPKFLRANRRRDEIDALFTMLEELVDDVDKVTGTSATLAAVDGLSRGQFKRLQHAFYSYLDEYGDYYDED